MKKLLFLSVCLSVVTYAQAQVAFNPKIGVNFSQITSKDVALSENGAKAGFNVGIDFRIGNEDSRVFFQPGLHYYNVGSRFKLNASESDDGESGTVRTDIEDVINVHSLRVPLTAGVYLTNTDSPVRVRLNGGIAPAFVLGVGDSDINIQEDDFETIYWNLNGGLGFDFSIVTLDFSYDHALSDVVSEANIDGINANNINGRNRGVSISVGVVL